MLTCVLHCKHDTHNKTWSSPMRHVWLYNHKTIRVRESREAREPSPGRARMSDARPGKRSPVPLRLECGVCGAPAPEHRHFGGQPASHLTVLCVF